MPFPDNYMPAREKCVNYECENDHEWQVKGVIENGMFWADDEDDEICPECGKEGSIS